MDVENGSDLFCWVTVKEKATSSAGGNHFDCEGGFSCFSGSDHHSETAWLEPRIDEIIRGFRRWGTVHEVNCFEWHGRDGTWRSVGLSRDLCR